MNKRCPLCGEWRHRAHFDKRFCRECRCPKDDFRAMCRWFNNACLCCGRQAPLAADHVIPLALGGDSSLRNMQPLCKRCNSKKHIKTIDYRNPVLLAALLISLGY